MLSDFHGHNIGLPPAADQLGPRPVGRNPPGSFVAISAWLTIFAIGQVSVQAIELKRQVSEVTTTASIPDAIAQNTPGYSEGYPVGVPKTYAWCNGSYKPPENRLPPSDFTAVTGWGRVYPKFGAPASNADAKIMVANAKTYMHVSATKEWILVQDQMTDEIAGAQFVADFSRNSAIEIALNAQPDGSVLIDSPRSGYNDLFWIAKRGTYAAGSVDGVYVQMDMRTNDPNIKLVANVGADWWRDPESEYARGFTNNRAAGASNWVELSTQWVTLSFYSGTTEQFRSDPPPPFAEATPGTKRVVAQRGATTSSPCLRAIAPR